MAKMTKEQTIIFDKLYKTTLKWGDDENCTGLFRELGGCIRKFRYVYPRG